MNEIAILVIALILDLTLGELPASLHPVVWMGRLITFLERYAPENGRGPQLLYGAAMVCFGVLLFAVPVWVLLGYLEHWPTLIYIFISSLLLKATFAVKELHRAAQQVKGPLLEGKVETARARLRSLVSRNTDELAEPLTVAAAVESVAENTNDSFVAPLFYYLLFGVPGAIAYRLINTFDSMIGYHGRYEYLGKVAARLDDLANFVPARLAALFMVIAAHLTGNDAQQAWHMMLRYRRVTESPNAGWTMSAMAGALGVQLEKVGHYKLGETSTPLSPAMIDQSLSIMWATVTLTALFSLAIEVVRHAT
ncbi:MAG: cobalamin biosynthesis protein [Chloroflexi bacterium]|nr:cobalamin biosynthesis protein [Chloroflexota bacterium]